MSIKNAMWIAEKSQFDSPIFRKTFKANQIQSAIIDICGLGWFELYVNGKPATDAVLEPAVSTYSGIEGRRLLYPLSDKFANPRVYYCRHDITELLRDGENLISVWLGNGFYNQLKRDVEGDFGLGCPRLAFSLSIKDCNGKETVIESDTSVLAGKSHIIENNLFFGEVHDLSKKKDFHATDFDDSDFCPAIQVNAPAGELTLFDFPYDKVIRTIAPCLVGEYNGKRLYDLGENISGRLKFDIKEGYKETLKIEHSEEIYPNFSLDFASAGGAEQIQSFTLLCDGKAHKDVYPRFSWQAFRYFTLEGSSAIENLVCQVIHTEIEQTAFFECDNKLINSILDMYIRTQLTNIHGCVPSDCPHRERLGYTGDGQVTCETTMTIFDMRQVYRKWMRDITDCQNTENGHIQHTAPFFGGGGGPGGWGGAVVVLPYVYHKIYGDSSLVKENLDAILSYLSYMESHCENELVTTEEKGGWCLGDWAFGDRFTDDPGALKNEFVNTAYLVKFYDMMLSLDSQICLGIDRERFLERKSAHAKAILENYFDQNTGNFCSNHFAANAFAIDIGLGDRRTLENLAQEYDKLSCLTTGIFGTEILFRVLCENGYAGLAFKLLTSEKENSSFGYMLSKGATTIWENWWGGWSHNHPMFGGCMKILWTAFLGIKPICAGYKKVLIAPCDIAELGNIKGSVSTVNGKVSVVLERTAEKIKITVDIPNDIEAAFSFKGIDKPLSAGINVFDFQA